MANTQLDARQSVLRTALGMAGTSVNDSLDTIFPKIDAELGKLFEDRNVLLTDGGLITFTGTQILFTEALNITLNQKISGAAPQAISLGSSTLTLNNLEMWYAVIDRTAGTATTSIATSLPAATSVNQEVFLLTKRVDAGDGTQRVYWRNGMALNAGQTVRLGASGSGSGGSGLGDDLISLTYQASFTDTFDEGPTDSKSAVNTASGFTDPLAYSAAKGMYTISYDASKTIAAGTTTTGINMSSAPAFTVKVGDIVVVGAQARKITTVTNQTTYVVDAFSVAPTLAAQVTVSQAIHTKDIYNLPIDGNALSAAFSASFSDILVDYEDTTTAGDNIYDVNVAPVIAWSGSTDNTSYSDLKIRPTLETDLMTSVVLPTAGTALYLRFFAYKTSGSGTLNVLRYKTWLQKSTLVGTGGGVNNYAYAMLNGTGTPQNMTLGLVGGKTTVTLTWPYAIGVNPGSAESSIQVFINGAHIPRFVDATTTPGSSFTETSSTVITLDTNYSAVAQGIRIVQRSVIVDNSSANTSDISTIQQEISSGFQGFVDQSTMLATTVTGAPSSGLFYSSIIGRSAMSDFTRDLKPRMGLERVPVQQGLLLHNEFGPNGEQVFALAGDTQNQVRFIGPWTSTLNTAGQTFFASLSGTDSVEITFFGTGLNILNRFLSVAVGYTYSVDGAAPTSGTLPAASAVIDARSYNTNQVVNIVSGLTLGVHTIRIASTNTATASLTFYGFETVCQSTNAVIVNPGISYLSGKKYASASQSLVAYTDSVTGTVGGRMLEYQNADGTIGRAFRAVGTAATLASTDHTNEEVLRLYNFREFGNGRADDFTSSAQTTTRAFTLDDGSTTLIGSSIDLGINGGRDALRLGTNSCYFIFTFVGTGLDVQRYDEGTGVSDTLTVLVDGVSQGTLSTAGTTIERWVKICSNLPYGTHTVRITLTSPGGGSFRSQFSKFVVYQPKKPALPSGTVEIGDFNVMASFAAAGNNTLGAASTGVLRKAATREITYVGTWTAAGVDANAFESGQNIASTTATSYMEYTFFGTGVEWISNFNNIANTLNFTIDGASNLSGFTTSLQQPGSGMTFTSSTGVLSGTSSASGRVKASITGLTLGLHRIRITHAVGQLYASAIDVVTPVHSHRSNQPYDLQGTLSIGSQGILDTRKTTPVKDVPSQVKNVAQAFGVVSVPTTTSTVPVPIPDMFVAHSNKTGKVKISWSGNYFSNTAGAVINIAIFIDGTSYHAAAWANPQSGNNFAADFIVVPVPSGTHMYQLFWSANTGQTGAGARTVIVEEI